MFGSEEYAKEELVAEIGSAFLCQMKGVEKTVRSDHAQYLNNWIEIISESDNALSSAFSQAQKAVDYLDSLVKEEAA
jgi:antirestriction protein ArdC